MVWVITDRYSASVSSLSFIFLFLPCPSLSYPLLSLLSLFSLSLGDDTKWPTRVDMLLKLNTINQWINIAQDKAHFFSQKVLGPVVQNIISLTSWLVVKMLTAVVSTVSNKFRLFSYSEIFTVLFWNINNSKSAKKSKKHFLRQKF